MLLAVAVPARVSVVALVMPSPTTPLSGENEAMVGAAGPLPLATVQPRACILSDVGGREGVDDTRGAIVVAGIVPAARRNPIAKVAVVRVVVPGAQISGAVIDREIGGAARAASGEMRTPGAE